MKSGPPVYKPNPQTLQTPPAYRAEPANAGVQLKPATASKLEMRPAPPVYRAPGPSKALQPKSQLSTMRVETRPAPPVFSLNRPRPVVQQRPHGPRQAAPSPIMKAPSSSLLASQPQTGAMPAGRSRQPVIQPAAVWKAITSCFTCSTCCDDGQSSAPLLQNQSSIQTPSSTFAVSSVSRGFRGVIEQGDARVLQPGDQLGFGQISSCSIVYAENSKGGKVVYHWPFTVFHEEYVSKMKKTLGEIGWEKKDNSFSMMVYKQDGGKNVKEELAEFVSQLKATFTNNVDSQIYEDRSAVIMDGTGKVNIY